MFSMWRWKQSLYIYKMKDKGESNAADEKSVVGTKDVLSSDLTNETNRK